MSAPWTPEDHAILEGAIPAADIPIHDVRRLRGEEWCHTQVERRGELDACNRAAIGGMTAWWEGEWITWPICSWHAHMMGGLPYHHLVPLEVLVGMGDE